ncbi:hypothetical protein CC85DRAFT_289269 [Cutaneotrichosporon oleaginosum]|uniref:Uncharacterized protein n=1 Tax=Cutaneotrichosporon oleaginosum TaxID=879819 RepID=A0A0J1ATP2_9TREE|nr:uncharacterized protein CC85DRAFT_289269 [Cutaneotrichosporon oleaginosum]KLT38699.1 hypothetical protein CC85DRAFT_289269 [Cutaneotrichosporon oleaginosum]TXT07578.1 hypothetical protein COLE_04502 [Cutaneotrichosporon oleaginosum]
MTRRLRASPDPYSQDGEGGMTDSEKRAGPEKIARSGVRAVSEDPWISAAEEGPRHILSPDAAPLMRSHSSPWPWSESSPWSWSQYIVPRRQGIKRRLSSPAILVHDPDKPKLNANDLRFLQDLLKTLQSLRRDLKNPDSDGDLSDPGSDWTPTPPDSPDPNAEKPSFRCRVQVRALRSLMYDEWETARESLDDMLSQGEISIAEYAWWYNRLEFEAHTVSYMYGA